MPLPVGCTETVDVAESTLLRAALKELKVAQVPTPRLPRLVVEDGPSRPMIAILRGIGEASPQQYVEARHILLGLATRDD